PLGKLKELYSDWTIHHYTEKESKAALKRPDGTPMRNTTSSLITQKP
ncbi:MAG: hypothetical protein GWN55_17300, partial [Phycisphaerae bacterium]|nr:hypothetical protein [Phycisphaerae bacterium]NIV71093.1 hypothetical protein [Phycisphaerae bacterium]